MATNNVLRSAAQVFRQVREYPRTIRCPSFRSVTAGSPTGIVMPLGVTYHSLLFRFTIAGVPAAQATILTDVAKIKATIDGDPKLDASANEIAAIVQFWNARFAQTIVNDGVFRIDLSRPWDQEISAQDGPAWGCATGVAGGVGSFLLEVTLAGGSTIDGIEVFAEITDPEPLGRHFCLRRITDSFLVAGDKVISDWPKTGPDVAWYALHIDKTGGTGNLIKDLLLTVDQVQESERAVYGYIRSQFARYGCTQQAGFTHLPFARRGRPMEALPAVFQDARLTIGTTGSLGNFNVLVESMEGVDPVPSAA